LAMPGVRQPSATRCIPALVAASAFVCSDMRPRLRGGMR
jgi:hypothetical protein